MKQSKLLTSTLAAAALTAGLGFTSVANAEVEASVAVASSYLWRGYDLGTAAVSGDIVYSNNGFTAGMWVSSGDGDAGTEYDLFAGYGAEVGDFSYGFNIISYQYPTGQYEEEEGGPGDFMEANINLGYGPFSFSYYDNIAGDNNAYAPSEDYTYMTLGFDIQSWSFLYGAHDEGANNLSHLDISYAYNDNLSFTVSNVIDSDILPSEDESSPFFVVSYSIPIE